MVLKDYSQAPDKENCIALTMLECIGDAAMYIQENTSSILQSSINGKIWIDGLGVRTKSGELADYFREKANEVKLSEALYFKAMITSSIMANYPEILGPDMIDAALQFEKNGKVEIAKRLFQSIILDFLPLFEEVQQEENKPVSNWSERDLHITESLVLALEGLKRLGDNIDETLYNEAKCLLIEKKYNNG